MSQAERIKYIDDAINQKGFIKIKTTAYNFEVTEKTIKRDIEYIRDRFNAPIEYCKEKNHYYYTRKFRVFSFSDEKNLLFYVFLRSLLGKFDFIPFFKDKVLEELTKNLSKNYLSLSGNISYELPAHEFPDISIFQIILNSMNNKTQCSLNYININNNETQRYMEPLKIMNYSGLWYVISYCHKSKEIRTFELSRIKRISNTNKINESDLPEKTIEEYITKSFGIMKGKLECEDPVNVTIRFYNKAMMIVRKQTWHPSQTVVENIKPDNKFIEFTFPVSGYEEILTKVLQYGENAEVIKPLEFRELWMNTITKMCEKYL